MNGLRLTTKDTHEWYQRVQELVGFRFWRDWWKEYPNKSSEIALHHLQQPTRGIGMHQTALETRIQHDKQIWEQRMKQEWEEDERLLYQVWNKKQEELWEKLRVTTRQDYTYFFRDWKSNVSEYVEQEGRGSTASGVALYHQTLQHMQQWLEHLNDLIAFLSCSLPGMSRNSEVDDLVEELLPHVCVLARLIQSPQKLVGTDQYLQLFDRFSEWLEQLTQSSNAASIDLLLTQIPIVRADSFQHGHTRTQIQPTYVVSTRNTLVANPTKITRTTNASVPRTSSVTFLSRQWGEISRGFSSLANLHVNTQDPIFIEWTNYWKSTHAMLKTRKIWTEWYTWIGSEFRWIRTQLELLPTVQSRGLMWEERMAELWEDGGGQGLMLWETYIDDIMTWFVQEYDLYYQIWIRSSQSLPHVSEYDSLYAFKCCEQFGLWCKELVAQSYFDNG